ncbi:MAG: glycine oxidase ThiO [Pirellulales bacterium]
MSDCLVVGGGVIGLSIAYELAGHGRRVRVIDSGQPGREASWAGAGILPPAGSGSEEPLEQLAALSNRLHAAWSDELRASTQIDNGFRRSGAIYVARGPAAARQLEQLAAWAGARNIVAERLSPKALGEIEPALQPRPGLDSAYFVPQECQIRNPRHLKALLAGCANRGVEITPGVVVDDFDVRGDRVRAVRTNVGSISVGHICIAAGAWSARVASKLGFTPAIKPIRGQIVLLSLARPILSRIVNEGKRYLVPRPDGRLLVGSTEEDVGFDRGTTARAASDLLAFALGLVPALETAGLERSWAGLRPATRDGLPYLGRMPGLSNVFMAAGHFRGGLQLSTGTAVVMSQLIEGRQPEIDLSPFRLDRETERTNDHDDTTSTKKRIALIKGNAPG